MYKVKVNKQVFEATYDSKNKSIDGKEFNPDILEYNEGKFHIISEQKSYTAEILESNQEEKTFQIRVNNSIYSISISDKYDELLREMGIDTLAGKKVNDIKAPMPGLVLNVLVVDGQSIQKGDAILVLEAMKMENVLKSPADGLIRKVQVSKGDKVEKNQVMILLS